MIPAHWVNYAVYGALLIVGAVFVGVGLVNFSLWQNGGPGPGFFPVVSGGVVVLTASALLLRPSNPEAPPIYVGDLLPAAGVILTVLAGQVFGLIEAVGIFSFLWLFAIERRRLIESVLISAGLTFAIIGVFQWWLGVRFQAAPWSLISLATGY